MDALAIILYVLLVLNGYVFVRNFYVNKFCQKVINLCYEHNHRRIDESLNYGSAYDWFYDKHSYFKLLLSFKPLKLEYWWTKEEIERLMS